jgi:hypothetical protein
MPIMDSEKEILGVVSLINTVKHHKYLSQMFILCGCGLAE